MDKRPIQGDFLPNLCSVQAVFHLILVGELLAIALTVVTGGVVSFDWHRLGMLSMLIQWIVLTSAACLCPLRPWFRRQRPMLAGAISYAMVLGITMLYSALGAMLPGFGRAQGTGVSADLLLTNFMLAAVFAGIVLRYFYLQQQLQNQQRAELAYNKDNQEDKEPLFDAVDTVKDCLRAFADMVPAIEAKREVMYEAATRGFATATDLADYLVRKNIPFRDAHEVVGKAVGLGVKTGRDLAQMELAELQQFSAAIGEDVFDVLTLEGSVAARDHIGGTAPAQVRKAIERAQQELSGR